MFARVVTFGVAPDAGRQLKAWYEEVGAPSLRADPGFVDGMVLHDPASGQVIAISIWDTEKARAASMARHNERVGQVGATVKYTESPSTDFYDLLGRA